jgi:hypothetical protein
MSEEISARPTRLLDETLSVLDQRWGYAVTQILSTRDRILAEEPDRRIRANSDDQGGDDQGGDDQGGDDDGPFVDVDDGPDFIDIMPADALPEDPPGE